MTRKDFELIARVLRGARPPAEYLGNDAHHQWNVMLLAFIDALADTNPRFDQARFIAACQGDES